MPAYQMDTASMRSYLLRDAIWQHGMAQLRRTATILDNHRGHSLLLQAAKLPAAIR